MTVHALTLTNPGAEAGDASGWTLLSGGSNFVSQTGGGAGPRTGSRHFRAGNSGTRNIYQQVDVSAYATEIDAGDAAARAKAWAHSTGTTSARTAELYIAAIASDGTTVLGTVSIQGPMHNYLAYRPHEEFYKNLPSGTRYLRIGTISISSIVGDLYWDDFEFELSDAPDEDWPTTLRDTQTYVFAAGEGEGSVELTQEYALAAINYPTEEERTTQTFARVAGEPELSLENSQTYILVAIRRGAGSRRLRAWTFTQDDHDFYVLHLGDEKTLVLDLTTNQWSTWRSNGRNVWRAGRGLRWDLDNVAGDDTLGLLWNVNASARSDDDATGAAENRVPIRSVVRGLLPMRLREALSCARAVLTVSQADPVAEGVSITLRTSDDFAQTWLNHGELVLDEAGRQYDISWPSIGLVVAPGKIFEIIDTGYARRLDALDVDLGDEEGLQEQNG